MTARRRGLAVLAAPFVLAVVVLVVAPMAMTGVYGLTDATGLGPPTTVGLDNVRRAATDPALAASLRATLALVVLAVPLRTALAVGLGLLLARGGGVVRTARALVFAPTVLPEVVLAVFMLWATNPVVGPLGRLVEAVGVDVPLLSSGWGARGSIVALVLLPVGEAFLVVLAARRALDPATYEAATVDGATPLQQVRHVTLPALAPLVVLLVVRDVVVVLQATIAPAYLLTDGGPDRATLFLPLYVFDQTFEFFALGYGSLVSVLLLALTAVLAGVALMVALPWLRPRGGAPRARPRRRADVPTVRSGRATRRRRTGGAGGRSPRPRGPSRSRPRG